MAGRATPFPLTYPDMFGGRELIAPDWIVLVTEDGRECMARFPDEGRRWFREHPTGHL